MSTVSRAGRKGVCKRCGCSDLRTVWIAGQDKVLCRACRRAVMPCKIDYPRTVINNSSVYAAALWLNAQTKRGITRLDIAQHMRVAKSPHLIAVIERLADAGLLLRWYEKSKLNGRSTLHYAPWVDAEATPGGQQGAQTAERGITAPDPPWRAAKRARGNRAAHYSRTAGHDWRDLT